MPLLNRYDDRKHRTPVWLPMRNVTFKAEAKVLIVLHHSFSQDVYLLIKRISSAICLCLYGHAPCLGFNEENAACIAPYPVGTILRIAIYKEALFGNQLKSSIACYSRQHIADVFRECLSVGIFEVLNAP